MKNLKKTYAKYYLVTIETNCMSLDNYHPTHQNKIFFLASERDNKTVRHSLEQFIYMLMIELYASVAKKSKRGHMRI